MSVEHSETLGEQGPGETPRVVALRERLSTIRMTKNIGDLARGTGDCTWNAALVMKEFLLTRRFNNAVPPKDSPSGRRGRQHWKVLDVSSGNGFLGVACGKMGT